MSETEVRCFGCRQPITDKRVLRCSNCKEYYDLLCANVSEQRFYNTLTGAHREAWQCAICIGKLPRSYNTNSPVRTDFEGVTVRRGGGVTESPPNLMDVSNLDDTAHDTTMEVCDSGIGTVVAELRLIRQELSASRRQMEMLNENMVKLVSRMEACESRVDKLDERMLVLERRVDDSPAGASTNNSSMIAEIQQLKLELNERDQELLMNDIEISCIPEEKGESLPHIITTLASKLGVSLMEQDIVCATRVGPLPATSDIAMNGRPVRPRLIVVRLGRRVVRDQMLQAARVRRGVTTEGIGLPGAPVRFYINERLTRINRQLFRQAREIAGRLHWRFVWTRDGRIFVRQHQDSGAPRHRLRTQDDLVRVFGSEAVCPSTEAK